MYKLTLIHGNTDGLSQLSLPDSREDIVVSSREPMINIFNQRKQGIRWKHHIDHLREWNNSSQPNNVTGDAFNYVAITDQNRRTTWNVIY